MATRNTYNEKDIQSFQGLEGIRKRPAMYVGQPDSHGLWTILREALDNTADEFLAGRNTSGHLIVDPDGSYWIVDQGEGIPTGIITIKAHGTTLKMSALQAVVSELHTGGKFAKEGGAYSDGSRGTHGVGIKATNALSKVFEVWTRRDGKIWNLCYHDAKVHSEVAQVKTGPKLPHGIVVKNWGTVIHVVPDMKLFEKGSKLQSSDAMQWAKVTSYLNAGMYIRVTGPSGNTKEFYAANGVADYMAEQVAELKATELGDHFIHHSKEMDVALSFTDCEGMQVQGYTNGLHNPAGGLHVQGVLKAFSAVLNTYKMSKHEFKPSDLFEGVVGIVNFKIAAPAFNNQVKEKLIDERVVAPSYEQTVDALTAWFKKHKDLARILCDRATELRTLNDEFSNNKKLQRELKGVRGRSALPPKLSVARCEPGQRELFLMEGDSAGGCFLGSTEVRLHDGSLKSFTDLVADYEKGIVNHSIGYNLMTNQQQVVQITEPRITKWVSELIEIEMSDGTVVRCTADHRWLTTDGTYVAAGDLVEGQELHEITFPKEAT